MKYRHITLGLLCLPWLAWADVVSVPVLKQPVAKGQVVQVEDLTLQETDRRNVFPSTITSASTLVGQQAVRPLEAGQPINRLHVRVPPQVERNSAVTLRYVRGGVELVSQATALQDGSLGENIKVMNPATRATLVGVVTGPGTVEVK